MIMKISPEVISEYQRIFYFGCKEKNSLLKLLNCSCFGLKEKIERNYVKVHF